MMGSCPACGTVVRQDDGFCEGCGHRLVDDRDHVELELEGVAGVSNRGLRHEHNEDAMGASTFSYGFKYGIAAVVCDGVSNSPRPETASEAAAERATKVLADHLTVGTRPGAATRAAARAAAEAVSALATSYDDAPACTYVSAVVGRDSVTVGWVGDSPAYWLADAGSGASMKLTKADSLANYLVETEQMSVEEARRDRGGRALVKWLGADAEDSAPQVVSFEPESTGTVLICSDGLSDYLPDPEVIAAAIPDASADTLGAARTLVQIALDSGGHDNVTVVLIPFPPPDRTRR